MVKSIQSVERAVQILQCFTQKENQLGVSDLSRRLGLNKSTVFGILTTLEHFNLVEKVSDIGRYKLGIKLLELGNLVFNQLDIRQVAGPTLTPW